MITGAFPRLRAAGDQALVVELASDISPTSNARVRNLDACIRSKGWIEIIDAVPSYRSLLVYYDACRISFASLAERILELCAGAVVADKRSRRWRLPVRYGGECEADLAALSEKVGLDESEVIRIHASVEYMVYMVGFSPGFSYLGNLPKELEVVRKAVPAPSVPANSIQVGGAQTAVSSMSMPSGWYVIGRTPVRMFDAGRSPPFLLEAGDLVSFVPMSQHSFDEALAAAAEGKLDLEWEWVT